MNSKLSSAKSDNRSTKEDQAGSDEFAFAARVEARLRELDRDWAWLSREAHVSTSALSDMRTKGRIPRTDRAIAIARALGTDLEFLATGKHESREQLERIARASRDLSGEQLTFLRLLGRLSERERQGIYAMMAVLTGSDHGTDELLAPGTSTVQTPSVRFQAQD